MPLNADSEIARIGATAFRRTFRTHKDALHDYVVRYGIPADELGAFFAIALATMYTETLNAFQEEAADNQ